MTTNVLFMCPHSAAKSVAAAAFASREASRIGLDLATRNGGVDPDAIVLPVVREALESAGLPIHEPPRLASEADMAWADVIINIGCEFADLPAANGPMREWHITNFSDDTDQAFAELEAHSTTLIGELAAHHSARPTD